MLKEPGAQLSLTVSPVAEIRCTPLRLSYIHFFSLAVLKNTLSLVKDELITEPAAPKRTPMSRLQKIINL